MNRRDSSNNIDMKSMPSPEGTSELSALRESEQALAEWNNTTRDYPTDLYIHQLFEHQVERTPAATAVVSEGHRVSYRELNERANQLAHHLRELGIGSEEVVGICLERSVEMVIALLAVLKAGGAYLPLDPQYPLERLRLMMEDAAITVLLTQASLSQQLELSSEVQVVRVDQEWEEICRLGRENPRVEVSSENLAYVIYTSGSTGVPKGVMIVHRGATALLAWAAEYFTAEELKAVLATTSICFDLSVFELFAPLVSGGAVVLAKSAAEVGEWVEAEEVTLVNSVPSALSVMHGAGWWPRVRAVNLAGEVLKASVVREVKELAGRARVMNLYGPTEDTTYTTCGEVREEGEKGPSIGRAIANTEIYILDEELRAVPVGVIGELYIGGLGLARGYINRADATAEKFIPDPLSGRVGARLYRSGDRARYGSSGEIEFHGRADNQVKLRGYRIELGEVETFIEKHPLVRESVVVAREYPDGNKRLLAYLAPKEDSIPSAIELRTFLKNKLPEYMIPHAFVLLDKLPRTPNGKVDRHALPVPDSTKPHLGDDFIAAQTEVEKRLASIWSEVLRLNEVSTNDDFFALGGDSLLATQIISRVRHEFQVEMPLRSLFENVTIATFARHITDESKSFDGLRERSALSLLDEDKAPLSFAQQRMWVLHQLLPGSSVYNIPLVIHLKGRLKREVLERSLSEIVRRHEILRATFTNVEGEPVQRFSAPVPVELPSLDFSALPQSERETEVQSFIAKELEQPFDLTRGPLLRAVLLRVGEEKHVLLISMHHIVGDGWSVDILIQELAALYEAYFHGHPSPLEELSIQYADSARLQRERLQQDVLKRQLEYWRRQLSGLSPVLNLPTDRPRPPVQSFRGATHELSLPATLTQGLRQLGQRSGATLFMTLLAAFETLLHRHTGQVDVAIGAPIAGRNRVETEKMIGLFLNTLVLRVNVKGNPTFIELMERVKEVCLGAYAHQDVPFERLVEELRPERTMSHTPLFQVMFNMLNYEGERVKIKLPELTLDAFEVLENGSKFDLTLYAREQRDTILFSIVYNADIFEPSHIAGIFSQFETLLESIVSDPQRPISELPLLTEEERERLREQKNPVGPGNDFVRFETGEIEQSIGRRFAHQVEAFPNKTAIKTRAYQWSYGELNRRAVRVADLLNGLHGTGPERIALLFNHDAPMVAALLGVLMTGKTYVPLDAADALYRLRFMLEDSRASVILTDNRSLAVAEAVNGAGLPVINLDDEREEPRAGGLHADVSPEAVAYLLYTSGSTGQPKGVMQSHRNVLHHIRCYTNSLHICAEDRLTLLSSYGFDAAVMDIFGALLNGATLYPIDLRDEGFMYLEEYLARERVTIYHSTPTVFRYFADGLMDALPDVRLVVLGGEEVLKTDVELYKEHFSDRCLLVNGFGPTESTLGLQYFMDKGTEIRGGRVPIGYPVEATELFLMSEAGERVATYALGEMVVSSEHVALGYWRDEALTRKLFAEHPQGGGKRMYRTGDLGRMLPDGSIEYRGRKDWQAKVRGYRIEPAEIEAVLRQHAEVCETVVMLREDVMGEKVLVAYVVTEDEAGPDVADLRAYVKERLPEYMVPALFIKLEELPLTHNGKVNREALPTPEARHRISEEGYVAPSTPEEEKLAAIWAQLLRVERVGVHDNFFDLGGDSLKASQLASRLRDAFSVEVSINTLFEKSTVAEQAELMMAQQ